MKIYWDPRDVWIGYFRGDAHHYVCPIPCLVIRWSRKHPVTPFVRREAGHPNFTKAAFSESDRPNARVSRGRMDPQKRKSNKV